MQREAYWGISIMAITLALQAKNTVSITVFSTTSKDIIKYKINF